MSAISQIKWGWLTKIAYWGGQIAEGVKSTAFGAFLLFYYNQVLGLSGTASGLAIMISVVFDAVTDPLIGSVSDGWRSRWGRRHPFMYASALPMGLSLYLIFNPMVDTQVGLFAWLLVFSILTRLTMTLYSVPHLALGAEMSSEYHERTVIAAGRSIFGRVGEGLVYLTASILFVATAEFENGQLDESVYPFFALVISLLVTISIFGSALGTHHVIPSLLSPEKPGHNAFKQVVLDTAEALKNISFRWVLTGFLVVSMPVGVGGALVFYMNTFFWQISTESTMMILLAYTISVGIGYFFAPLFGQYLEKRFLLGLGALGWGLFAIAPVCLHYLGLFPTPGSGEVVYGLGICQVMAGLLVSQVGVAVSSMLADVADEQELSSKKRQEGVFFGTYVFVLKATSGIGGAIAGIALDLISWPLGDNVKTFADVPAESLFLLSIVAGPGLAIGVIPAVWCFSKYSLGRDRLALIQAELAARQQR